MFCYITLFLQHFSNSMFLMNRKQPHMFYGVNVSAMVIWRYFCNDYRYRLYKSWILLYLNCLFNILSFFMFNTSNFLMKNTRNTALDAIIMILFCIRVKLLHTPNKSTKNVLKIYREMNRYNALSY